MEMIIDSNDYRYMSEFMKDLPDNVMLNKVITGCGGTTVALLNDIPYVICVPYKTMITNKMNWAQANNVLLCPVMGTTSDETILNFRGIKFMVTYDSLERLCKFIDPSKYKILIDESHKLIDSASFRGEAIRSVLTTYLKFNAHVFMSATPVKDRYQLPSLREIPKAKIKWYNVEPVEINYNADATNLTQTIAFIAAKHLTGEINSNAHIFINSVSTIIDTINTIDYDLVSPDLVNIVCANNQENQEKLNTLLGVKYIIKNVGEVNKVNFYTSTAFEGSDIYDTEGQTYIVTDGKKDYTKNDILTTLPQIIGRIRDSKFNNKINLIFTPSPYYNYTTEDEFEAYVKKSLRQAADLIKSYNSTDNPMLKEAIFKDAETNRFLLQKKDEVLLNENALYNEMHAFDTLHNTYYAFSDRSRNGNFSLNVNDTIYKYLQQKSFQIKGVDKLILRNKKSNFEKLCIDYLSKSCSAEAKSRINTHVPLIKQAIEVIGADRMKALRFEKKLIKNELIKIDTLKSKEVKIVKLLNYEIGQYISLSKLKKDLNDVYGTLGIGKVKTSAIFKWYEVKLCFRKNKNTRKNERGYSIIDCKIKIPENKKELWTNEDYAEMLVPNYLGNITA